MELEIWQCSNAARPTRADHVFDHEGPNRFNFASTDLRR